MNKIIFITIIIIILTGGSFFLFRSGFGKKEVLSTPDTLVESMVKEGISPTSTPSPTPVPTKLDYEETSFLAPLENKMDLSKELESVDPQVLDSDFEKLQSIVNSL